MNVLRSRLPILLVLLAICSVAIVVTLNSGQRLAAQGRNSPKWEYHMVTFRELRQSRGSTELAARLTKRGEDGWELAHFRDRV